VPVADSGAAGERHLTDCRLSMTVAWGHIVSFCGDGTD
jgi:hypothetical protein